MFTFVLLCLAASFGILNCQENIQTCSGFVRPSKELSEKIVNKLPKIDYQSIKILLKTSATNQVKETTDCAPPNGYYIIPIYDKGDYYLEISDSNGWTFAPHKVDLRLDTEECKNSFEITGFAVRGQLKFLSLCTPSLANNLIELTLSAVNDPSALKLRATVNPDGTYEFRNVMIGEYVIAPSATSANELYHFDRASTAVSVVWGVATVAPENDFTITGYHVEGRVIDKQDERGAGVSNVVVKLSPAEGAEATPPQVAESGQDGVFRFKNVACGQHRLEAEYRVQATSYQVSPSELTITVTGISRIEQPFVVNGFSVSGRVVRFDGSPFEGVEVSLAGFKRITGKDGKYQFSEISSGSYTVTAARENYAFSSLANHRISSAENQLPDIAVSRVRVSGQILLKDGQQAALSSRAIIIRSDESAEESTTTDVTGKYSLFLRPSLTASYTLIPTPSAEEKARGLQLNSQTIRVTGEPVIGVDFGLSSLIVKARVIALTTCPSLTAVLSSKERGHELRARSVPGEDVFLFNDVLPGLYDLSISEDDWSWETDSFRVEVKSSNVTDIVFRQTGYLATVLASHDIVLRREREKAGSTEALENVNLKKGVNRVRVPQPGVYSFSDVGDCYRYEGAKSAAGETDRRSYDTSRPEVIAFQAVAFKYAIKLIAPSQDGTVAIRLNSTTTDGEQSDVTTQALNSESYIYAERDSVTRIIPELEGYFFSPNDITLRAREGGYKCAPTLTFEASKGVYLLVSISPAVPNVKLTLTPQSENNANAKPQSDDASSLSIQSHYRPLEALQFVMNTVPGQEKAEFSLGPVRAGVSYDLKAEKEGMYLKEVAPGRFAAQKLASISIKVVQGDVPLPGVLLSLNGENLVKNDYTDENGELVFANLFPGGYNVKPLLKEYAFNTAPYFELQEGEDHSLRFDGVRVSYSCFGRVSLLNKAPLKAVVVEAVGPTVLDTTTDANGEYRIRGLQPLQEYRLQVQLPSIGDFVRVQPLSYTFTTGAQDVNNKDFVLFKKFPKFDIIGHVVVPAKEDLRNITVQLHQGSDLVAETNSTFTEYFLFPNVAADVNYTVSIKNVPSKEYSITTTQWTGFLNETTVITLHYEKTAHRIDVALDNGPFFMLLLVVTLSVCAYYRKYLAQELDAFRSTTDIAYFQYPNRKQQNPKLKRK